MKEDYIKIISLLIIVTLMCCIFGCDVKTNEPLNKTTENKEELGEKDPEGLNLDFKDYNLRFIDGKQYLQLKAEFDTSGERQQSLAVPYIKCDSLGSLFDKIKNDDFSDSELKELARFQKDENGIEIFNLNTPFKFVYPEDFSEKNIGWQEGVIYCNLENNVGERFKLGLFNKESFDANYSQYIENYPDSDGVELISHEKKDNIETTILVTSQAGIKLIKTYLENVVILEKYYLKESYLTSDHYESYDVPAMVMCFKDCGNYGIILNSVKLKKPYLSEYYLEFSVEY